jgi:ubiquinone/menaquinone biosynthesis C-methylase UbiE
MDPLLSPPYAYYASAYDGSGQIRFAILCHIHLRDLLAHHSISGRRLLDMACGTGTLALLMAGDGWEVTALDRSATMLAQAAAKLPPDQSVRLIEADMRQLPPELPAASFDLVTCTYDSLNYMLNTEDLAACFRAAAAALAPGGLYVADMNTRHFLEFDWGECAVREQKGYIQIERSHFVAETESSFMLLTGFVGNDERGYQRFDEGHVERAYPAELVEGLLRSAGLHVEATYDSFTLQPPGPETQRIFWVARRSGEV